MPRAFLVLPGLFILTLPALPADTPLGPAARRATPTDNPLTEAKVRLGRKLFFDPILSVDGKIACASCHQPDHGFASSTAVAVGVGSKRGRRNPPSLLNRAYGSAFFWDGRAATLEDQALHPIASPQEMGHTVPEAVKRLQASKEYVALFQAAFPDGVTATNLARALASFERVLLTGNTPVDRFRAGQLQALNESERHGLWLYESRAQCWRCHSGANFSDERFHNTGVSWGTTADLGRYEITRQEADRGRFKTPTLRGLIATAPYMHDGSLATLEEVVDFYNRGGGKNLNLDAVLAPLGLSKTDAADLVAFLKALSGRPGDQDEGFRPLRK
ncbi:MAG: cytochrome-c peroxidase [Planctomycetota bacterium]|nr:MAG: cytochrome-c peroxidase [Planctomycetota bacterium]